MDAEEIQATAPVLPWEICLRNSTIFYQRTPGGGMVVKFVPVAVTPQGAMPMPPGVEVQFNEEGWARFQSEVARDGEQSPIVVAGPGMVPKLNGDGGSGI